MAQVESGPGRTDPALLATVVSTVKHAGGTQPNPAALATVTSAISHVGTPVRY